MTEEPNIQLSAPTIRVAIYGEEDREINWIDLDETDQHNPATISDDTLLLLVANYLDMGNVDELSRAVYGEEADGKLIASRNETGTITVRPATVLGGKILDPYFKTFLPAMELDELNRHIVALKQCSQLDSYSQQKLDAYESDLSRRGEPRPFVSMVFDSNKGGAPKGE